MVINSGICLPYIISETLLVLKSLRTESRKRHIDKTPKGPEQYYER